VRQNCLRLQHVPTFCICCELLLPSRCLNCYLCTKQSGLSVELRYKISIMSLNAHHAHLAQRSAVRWQDHTRRWHSSVTYFALITLWMAALIVDAYPDGAPDTACVSMMPQHGVGGQTSAVPFSIATSTNSYSSGTQISGQYANTDVVALHRMFYNLCSDAKFCVEDASTTHTDLTCR
jgi:hypothetical protein